MWALGCLSTSRAHKYSEYILTKQKINCESITLDIVLFLEYSLINSTKSPASGASNVSDPIPKSQVGIVREVMCV